MCLMIKLRIIWRVDTWTTRHEGKYTLTSTNSLLSYEIIITITSYGIAFFRGIVSECQYCLMYHEFSYDETSWINTFFFFSARILEFVLSYNHSDILGYTISYFTMVVHNCRCLGGENNDCFVFIHTSSNHAKLWN